MFISLLFLTACTTEDAGVDDSWRPTEEVQVTCPWLSQGYGTLNCGPTSLVMAAGCIEGYDPDYTEVIELIQWMDVEIDSYGGAGDQNLGSLTDSWMLQEAANGFYALDAQRFDEDGEVTLATLYQELQGNTPVLIATYGQSHDTEVMVMAASTEHYMLLVGMDEEFVCFNDPAKLSDDLGERRCFTTDSFLEVGWQDRAGVRFTED